MAMNTTITPMIPVTTILGPNYLDCQHQLTVDEFQGVVEVQMTLTYSHLTVDLRGTKPDVTDINKDVSKRRRVTYGIRLTSKSSGDWKRETPMPDTPKLY